MPENIRKGSMLVIDDDDELRQALSRSLGRRGWDVAAAANTAQALAETRRTRPDRIVLDLVIGAEEGISLIKPLLQLVPGARLVVLTGYGTVRTAVSALQLGAFNYLTKPVDIDELLAAFEHSESAEPRKAQQPLPTLDELEREHLQKVLYTCQGNVTKAAKMLRMHRRSLQRKLQKIG